MKEPIELYLHIPFCVRKCRYCDFLSFPCEEQNRERYVEALLREIRLCGEHQAVRSVFLGGGTPSLLSGEDIVRLMSAIREVFVLAESCEITIEANPGTVTEEKAALWKRAGINRVSMGVQSFDNGLLKRLGRIHTAEEALASFRILRSAGFSNLSLDLMMGLPGQDLLSWSDTLHKAVSLHPEHLSCYSLIVEEGTPFFEEAQKGLLVLPTDEDEREMYHSALSFLARNGYEQYEISNFAKPGFESRHNKGYWERVPYLGMGLGASSLIRTDEGDIRFRNTDCFDDYLGFTDLSGIREETELLSPREAQEEFMFLGLRKTDGISEADFEEEFRLPVREVYGAAIEKNMADGLLEEKNGRLFLTARGTDLGNIVFASFLQD